MCLGLHFSTNIHRYTTKNPSTCTKKPNQGGCRCVRCGSIRIVSTSHEEDALASDSYFRILRTQTIRRSLWCSLTDCRDNAVNARVRCATRREDRKWKRGELFLSHAVALRFSSFITTFNAFQPENHIKDVNVMAGGHV